MKKILAMAAVMAFASGAYAESEFSHNAEYRVRYQYDQNITGNKDTAPTSQDAFVHRLKFGTTFKATEKLSATFTLLHNAGWGSNDLGGENITGSNPTGDSKAVLNGTNDGENMILVQEAYGSWMISDEFMLRFGRGSFTLADGNLIGANDWEATPYSFEGALGTYEMEAVRLSVWGVRFAEWDRTISTANYDDDPEANSFGLSVDVKSLPDALSMVNIHVLQNNNDEVYNNAGGTVVPKKGELRYGVAIGGDTAGVDYHANYEAHTGESENAGTTTDVEGMMYQVELGYTLAEVMNSRFYVLYHSDSGDSSPGTPNAKDDTYDPYFYEMHSNAGLMDVVKWGNLTYISVGYTLDPMEDLNVGLHYHMFSKTEKADGASAGANGTLLGTTSTDDDKLGDEIDLVATKKYEGGFEITGRAGMFMPGDAVKNGTTAGDDTYTQVYLQGKMNF